MEVGSALGGILFLLILLAAIVFWIWALVDAARVPDDGAYRTGNKVVWVLVIALAHFVGAVIYCAVGRPRTA